MLSPDNEINDYTNMTEMMIINYELLEDDNNKNDNDDADQL